MSDIVLDVDSIEDRVLSSLFEVYKRGLQNSRFNGESGFLLRVTRSNFALGQDAQPYEGVYFKARIPFWGGLGGWTERTYDFWSSGLKAYLGVEKDADDDDILVATLWDRHVVRNHKNYMKNTEEWEGVASMLPPPDLKPQQYVYLNELRKRHPYVAVVRASFVTDERAYVTMGIQEKELLNDMQAAVGYLCTIFDDPNDDGFGKSTSLLYHKKRWMINFREKTVQELDTLR